MNNRPSSNRDCPLLNIFSEVVFTCISYKALIIICL